MSWVRGVDSVCSCLDSLSVWWTLFGLFVSWCVLACACPVGFGRLCWFRLFRLLSSAFVCFRLSVCPFALVWFLFLLVLGIL